MAIIFHTSDPVQFHVKQKVLLKNWIKHIITSHSKSVGQISIILVTDEELLQMNKDVLNHDYYTDIITFQYDYPPGISGDLYISIDRIKENAVKFAISTNEELHRVMIHGVLHLLGFKDKKKNEAAEMRQKENDSLKVLREMFHVKYE